VPLSLFVCLRHGFDVVHIANPPDLLWLVAAPYRLFGKQLIFDQHDLVPELFEVRYGRGFSRLTAVVLAMERISYQLANHVITTNETFRQSALERGGVSPDKVTVVRNGPRLGADFPIVVPDPHIRRIGEIMVGYLGIMNEQDHVEVFLEMARVLRFDLQRTDIGFVMVGDGDAFPRLRNLRDQLGLREAVVMTGRIPWPQVLSTMAATDICVQPDLPTVFSEKLTMSKLMEYMALGKAVVAFDMPETRVSGGTTVVYVDRYDAHGLAIAVSALADDSEMRQRLGVMARRRIEDELAWEHQAERLLHVYDRVLGELVAPAPGGDQLA
jgi:glycosyltransferase involved in cell wall biosynthesis